jgi:hypothetical protein
MATQEGHAKPAGPEDLQRFVLVEGEGSESTRIELDGSAQLIEGLGMVAPLQGGAEGRTSASALGAERTSTDTW